MEATCLLALLQSWHVVVQRPHQKSLSWTSPSRAFGKLRSGMVSRRQYRRGDRLRLPAQWVTRLLRFSQAHSFFSAASSALGAPSCSSPLLLRTVRRREATPRLQCTRSVGRGAHASEAQCHATSSKEPSCQSRGHISCLCATRHRAHSPGQRLLCTVRKPDVYDSHACSHRLLD